MIEQKLLGKVRNIYLASSWRNGEQQQYVQILRALGHTVYDFKNPPGRTGFSWKQIDPNWEAWTPSQYRAALKTSQAIEGYCADMSALQACDTCVLLLPSGRSASWEFGYAMGEKKDAYVIMTQKCEPELMYREAIILTSLAEVIGAFR